MKIAITGTDGALGRRLVPPLGKFHSVRPFDIKGGEDDCGFLDVLNSDSADHCCTGMDAVVHLAAAKWDSNLSSHENATRILGTRLKGTYNIMNAAVKADVQRVIQISDLIIYSGYDRDLIVSEDFVPLPDTSPYQPSVYLSELVGREFSRTKPGLVLTLRVGDILDRESSPLPDVGDESWVYSEYVVAAVSRCLELRTFDAPGHWGLYNLAADLPASRFTILKIQSGQFGFTHAVPDSAGKTGGAS